MLTWQDFYKELGVTILCKDLKTQNHVDILVFEVDINQIIWFLRSRGFCINSTLSFHSIKQKPGYFLYLPYYISGISFGTKKGDCCFCNKPLNIYDLLIYIASQIYFRNTTASYFDEFRVITSDGYDVSIIKRVCMDPVICIGYANGFVDNCFYSRVRFCLSL